MSAGARAESSVAERPAHVAAERVVDFDFYSLPDATGDLHQAWKVFQDSAVAEIVWTPRNGGHWIATSGRLISHIFADYERFSSRVVVLPKSSGEHYAFIPATMDPPAHRPYRTILTDGLSPKAVNRIAPKIRELAAERIEELRLKGTCNFTTDFADHLPINVFMDVMGLPPEDGATVKSWVGQMSRPDGSMSYQEVMDTIITYIASFAEERRGGTGSDLVTRIVNSAIEGRALTRTEAARLCGQILVGGIDTVVNLLSFIMRHLALHEAARRPLVEDPDLIRTAVEEFIGRFPLISDAREVKTDMIFEDVEMKQGDMILLPTALHGLDARENHCPLELDYRRSAINHSTFGNGSHKCPGAHLSRIEVRIVLEEWLARIPEFTIPKGAAITFSSGVVASLTGLPLIWDPAATRDSGAIANTSIEGAAIAPKTGS